MESLKKVLKTKTIVTGKKYVTREFQDFGVRIAEQLRDTAHKALYIKMAKEKDRRILERALSYTLDYPNAQKPARIFMWKVKDLEKKMKEDKKEAEPHK